MPALGCGSFLYFCPACSKDSLCSTYLSGFVSERNLIWRILSLNLGPMTDPVENVTEILFTFSKSWLNPTSKLRWLYCWKAAASLEIKQTSVRQSPGEQRSFNAVSVILGTVLGEEDRICDQFLAFRKWLHVQICNVNLFSCSERWWPAQSCSCELCVAAVRFL